MNEINKDKSFSTPEKKSKTLIPYAMLCELTHRCPLSCPYCSNPVELELKSNEISTDLWKTALSDGAKIGISTPYLATCPEKISKIKNG